MYSIGQVAKLSGCKVQTIRYYEDIGLMPAAKRNAGNQRIYDDQGLDTLKFIRHARAMGFHIDDIKALLRLHDHHALSCQAADDIARHHLEAVQNQIKQLQRLETELKSLIEQCKGGRIEDCQLIKTLSDHHHCDDHPPLEPL